MNCNEAKNLFPDKWADALDAAKTRELELHVSTCAACREERESLSAVWNKLWQLPDEQPSPEVRPKFYAMLEGYQQGLKTAQSVEQPRGARPWFGGRVARRPAFQFGFATLLLLLGFLSGYSFKPSANSHEELASLREELHDMRRMVMVSLMKQESASERLKGISWSGQVNQPDPELLFTLMQTLNYDPNVNVRLAAVDALSRFSNDPTVRKGLIQTLQRQNSPLVQIAIIDLLVQLHDRQSIDVLKQLSNDQETNKVVQQRARWGLQKLS